MIYWNYGKSIEILSDTCLVLIIKSKFVGNIAWPSETLIYS